VCVSMVDKKEVVHCPVCLSKQIYTLKDGTRVCRKCGHRTEVLPAYVN